MDLTQIKHRLPIIAPVVVIIVLIILIAFVYAFFNPREKPPTPTSQPTPTPTAAPYKLLPEKVEPEKLPVDVQTTREKIIASQIENRRGDLILYKPGPYEITYIPTPKIFFVTLFQNPVEVYKKQAQNWFLNFGLKQTDLCDLPVRFVFGSRELKNANPNFVQLPDGCPI